MCFYDILAYCLRRRDREDHEQKLSAVQSNYLKSAMKKKGKRGKSKRRRNLHVNFQDQVQRRSIVLFPAEMEGTNGNWRAPSQIEDDRVESEVESLSDQEEPILMQKDRIKSVNLQDIYDLRMILKESLQNYDSISDDEGLLNIDDLSENMEELCSAYVSLLLVLNAKDPLIAAMKSDERRIIEQLEKTGPFIEDSDLAIAAATTVAAFENYAMEKEQQIEECNFILDSAVKAGQSTSMASSCSQKSMLDYCRKVFITRNDTTETHRTHTNTLWSVLERVTQMDYESEQIAEENFAYFVEYFEEAVGDFKQEESFIKVLSQRQTYFQALTQIKKLAEDILDNGLDEEKKREITQLILNAQLIKEDKEVNMKTLKSRLEILEKVNLKLASAITEAKEYTTSQVEVMESVTTASKTAQEVMSGIPAARASFSILEEAIAFNSMAKTLEVRDVEKTRLIADTLWNLKYIKGRCETIMSCFNKINWDYNKEENPYLRKLLECENRMRAVLRRARFENLEFNIQEAQDHFSEDLRETDMNPLCIPTMYLNIIHDIVSFDSEESTTEEDAEEACRSYLNQEETCSTESASFEYLSISEASEYNMCMQSKYSSEEELFLSVFSQSDEKIDVETTERSYSPAQYLELATLELSQSDESAESIEIELPQEQNSGEEAKDLEKLKNQLGSKLLLPVDKLLSTTCEVELSNVFKNIETSKQNLQPEPVVDCMNMK